MLSILLLGFVIGMRHALEADHLAAMATLATRSSSWRHACTQGVVWGLGHSLTLFVFGALVLVLNAVVPESLAQGLELAVGVMLAILGLDVLRRLLRQRVHFHAHCHCSGIRHFHAHTHVRYEIHDVDRYEHIHRHVFPYRALYIGLMHGMAGSAAMILLTL